MVNVTSLGRLGDHCSHLLPSLGKKGEALSICFKLGFDLGVSSHSHIHLTLVFEQALLVLLVNRSRGGSVEFWTILISQLRIFSLFSINNLLARFNYIKIELFHALSTLDSLREVLSRALLLELFDLGPDRVWHVIAGAT